MTLKRGVHLRGVVILLAMFTISSGCVRMERSEPVELVVVLPTALIPVMSRDALDALTDLYIEEHPHITFRVKSPTLNQLYDEHRNVRQDAPVLRDADLVFLPAADALALHEAGKLHDLSNMRLPRLNVEAGYVFDDVTMVAGQRIAIAYLLMAPGIALNDDVLLAAGIEPPSSDWTLADWDEVHAAVSTVQTSAKLPVAWFLDVAFGAFGAISTPPETAGEHLDEQAASNALVWLAEQVRHDRLSIAMESDAVATQGVDGLPMMALPAMGRQTQSMVVPWPKGPLGRNVPILAGVGVVPTAATHPIEATHFLQEMISQPKYQEVLARDAIRPVSDDASALTIWRETIGDRMADALELSLEDGWANPGYRPGELWPGVSVRDAMDMLTPFLSGSQSIDELLRRWP